MTVTGIFNIGFNSIQLQITNVNGYTFVENCFFYFVTIDQHKIIEQCKQYVESTYGPGLTLVSIHSKNY